MYLVVNSSYFFLFFETTKEKAIERAKHLAKCNPGSAYTVVKELIRFEQLINPMIVTNLEKE